MFDENLFEQPTEPEYEMCYVDADTLIFRAAKSLQKDFIIVEHNKTKWTARFDGVSKFYGLGKKRDGGWIGDENKKRAVDGRPQISADDFTIHLNSELIESPDPTKTLLEYGLQSIDFKIGDIKRTSRAKDYRLYIGDLTKNFRYDIAKIVPYKGERKEKPLMFLELREAFLEKYKNKAIVSKSNLESDDEISIKGWESYRYFLKTGKHKYVLAYIDKDLQSTPCDWFNYDKCEDGIIKPDINQCARFYTQQLLSGDKSTDNIQGLPNIGVDFATKYKLGKTRGVGKATAVNILEDCQTPVEMYTRVVEAYKSFYGEKPFDFESWDGTKGQRTWEDMLRENASLLYMCRSYEEAGTYDIIKQLTKMGVL